MCAAKCQSSQGCVIIIVFQAFVVFAAVLAAASAAPQVTIAKKGYGPSTIVRAPSHDSASIESHRFGGNFAYSTAEAHAFAEITPEISVATHPVAETTHTHIPAAVKTVQPAPVVHTTHAARPVFGEQPVFAQHPVVGPVREHTTYTQPIFKKQHVTVSQPHVTVAQQPIAVAAPVAAAAPIAAPVAVEGYAAAPVGLGYAAAGLPAAAPLGLGYAAAGLPYAAGIAAPAAVVA